MTQNNEKNKFNCVTVKILLKQFCFECFTYKPFLLFLIYIFLPSYLDVPQIKFRIKLFYENNWFYDRENSGEIFSFKGRNLEGFEKHYMKSNFILCTS